jgi:hypothetical protein
MMATDPTEAMVQAFTQKMRETYVMLGKSLIPMMGNTPEDIQTYERARQLNSDCLPESARAFLDTQPGPVM